MTTVALLALQIGRDEKLVEEVMRTILVKRSGAFYIDINERIRKKLAEVNEASREVRMSKTLPYKLTTEELVIVQRMFSEYRVSVYPSLDATNHLFSTVRMLARDYLRNLVYDFQEGVVEFFNDVKTIIWDNKLNHHACYVFSHDGDEGEHVEEMYNVVRTYNSVDARHSLSESISMFSEDPSFFKCTDPGTCKKKAGACLFDHTLYSMPLEQVATVMKRRGFGVAYGYFIYSPEMLVEGLETGVLPSVAGRFYRDEAHNTLRIVAGNERKLSSGWDLAQYLRYAVENVIYACGEVFSYEIVATKGNLVFYKVVSLGSDSIESTLVNHVLWEDELEDRVVIKAHKLKNRTLDPTDYRSYEDYQFTVPKKPFEATYIWANNVNKQDLLRDQVYEFYMNANDKAIIAGGAIVMPQRLDKDHLGLAVNAVFGECFESRFNENVVTSQACATELMNFALKRKNIGSLAMVYLNTVCNNWYDKTIGDLVRNFRDWCLKIDQSNSMKYEVADSVGYTNCRQLVNHGKLFDSLYRDYKLLSLQFHTAFGGSKYYTCLTNRRELMEHIYKRGCSYGSDVISKLTKWSNSGGSSCSDTESSTVCSDTDEDVDCKELNRHIMRLSVFPKRIVYLNDKLYSYLSETFGSNMVSKFGCTDEVSNVCYIDMGARRAGKLRELFTGITGNRMVTFVPEVVGRVKELSDEAKVLVERIVREADATKRIGPQYEKPKTFVETLEVTTSVEIIEPPRMANPLNVIQNAYDKAFPGASLSSRVFDWGMINCQDLKVNMETVRMRLNLTKKLPMKTEVTFDSKLKTAMVPPVQQLLTTTLLATAKRNCNIPTISGVVHTPTLVDDVLHKFLETFCIPHAQVLINKYRDNPITVNEDNVEMWVSRFEDVDLKKLRSSGFTLSDKLIDRYTLSLKKDGKATVEKGAKGKMAYPQVVNASEKGVNGYFSPLLMELRARIMSVLKPNVMLNMRKSSDDIRQFLNVHEVYGIPVNYGENDFSKYDKSQDWTCMYIVWSVCALFGFNVLDLDAWINGHIKADSISMPAGIRLLFYLQQRSGDAATALFNSIINMSTVSQTYDIEEYLYAMFLGDDSQLAMLGRIDEAGASEKMAELFNLAAKFEQTPYGAFCSNFIVKIDSECRTEFMPDPFKRIEKLSVCRAREESTLDDMYQSYAELMKPYNDYAALKQLDVAVQARYHLSESVMNTLLALNTLAVSKDEFRKMYSDTRSVKEY